MDITSIVSSFILDFFAGHPVLTLKGIFLFLLCTIVFEFLFVNIMWIKRGIESNKWVGWKLWLAWLVGYPLAAIGVLYDIAYNYTWGTITFLQFPRSKEYMYTDRLQRCVKLKDWRGVEARFICKYLVEPYDDKHCGNYK